MKTSNSKPPHLNNSQLSQLKNSNTIEATSGRQAAQQIAEIIYNKSHESKNGGNDFQSNKNLSSDRNLKNEDIGGHHRNAPHSMVLSGGLPTTTNLAIPIQPKPLQSKKHSQPRMRMSGSGNGASSRRSYNNPSSHAPTSMNTEEIAAHFLSKFKDETSEMIAASYLKVNQMLENLNIMTDMIIQEHEKGYTEAYKEHMLKVQCELINLKRKTSDYYIKMKRDERIKFLETSIHWLRDEAFKLARQIEQLKDANKGLRDQLEEKEKENEFMIGYTRATKKENLLLKKTIEQLKDPENLKKYGDAVFASEKAGASLQQKVSAVEVGTLTFHEENQNDGGKQGT